MKYPKEYLDEIKTRLKVSSVVSKTVSLKKRGKEEKPVGTVWISVADSEGVFSQKLTLDGDRSAVRHGTVLAALTLLLEHLVDEETDL